MLITGMNPKELLKEASEDLKRVAAWFPKHYSIVERWIPKQKKLPAWYCTESKSARNNIWKCMWCIKNKRTRNGPLVEYTIINGRFGRYVVKPQARQNGFTIMVFIPHFFKRYRERLKLGDKLTPEQLIRRYLRRNTSGINTGKDLDVELTTKEGIALGNIIFHQLILIRTFITYDMAKGNQIKRFEEGHEEMTKMGAISMYDEDVVAEMKEIGINAEDFAKKVEELKQKNKNNK